MCMIVIEKNTASVPYIMARKAAGIPKAKKNAPDIDPQINWMKNMLAFQAKETVFQIDIPAPPVEFVDRLLVIAVIVALMLGCAGRVKVELVKGEISWYPTAL